MDIHKKLILLICSIVVIPLGIMTTISTLYLENQFTKEQNRYLQSTLAIALSEMEQRQEDIKRACLCLAQDADTLTAIRTGSTASLVGKMGLLKNNFNKVDYAVVIDANNRLLSSQRPNIQYNKIGTLGKLNQEALQNRLSISSTEVIPLAELFLPQSEEYRQFATKLKTGLCGKGELMERALCEVTIVPILDTLNRDTCLGSLIVIGIANSEYYFPKYISSKVTDGFLVLTIDGVRVATKTTIGEEKDWMVGTPSFNKDGIPRHQDFLGRTTLNGVTYAFCDRALYNHAGKPIGYLSFGLDEERFTSLVADNRNLGFFVVILCLIFFIPVGQLYVSQLKHSHYLLELTVMERTQHLETAVAQLKKLDAARTSLMANLTHELRTPLCVVINACDILKAGYIGSLNPKQQEYIKNASACGNHLLELINNLLDISKMAAGKTVLRYEEVSLKALVDSTVAGMKSYRAEPQAKLTVSLEPEDFTLVADAGRLKQILYNLLSNAIKFTPATGHIHLNIYKRDKCMEAVVRDDGIGIAPEDQARVFDEFEQADSSYTKKYAGTGLGLPIVKKLVELHGGQIYLKSDLNKGTEIVFTIPLVPPRENNPDL